MKRKEGSELLRRHGGWLLLLIMGIVIGLVSDWLVFGRSVDSYIGLGNAFLCAMLLLFVVLQVLANGFSGSTSLDEFLELLDDYMVRLGFRTGEHGAEPSGSPPSVAEALILIAIALRSGFLIFAAVYFLDAVLGYLHPMGG